MNNSSHTYYCHLCKKERIGYAFKVTRGENKERIEWCKGHWQTHLNKENKENNKVKNDELADWYKFQYKRFGGKCQETDRPLSFDKKFVAHLLPKKRGQGGYPYLRTHEKNGILVSWNIHSIIDKGTAQQRKSLKIWSTIQQERKKLLREIGFDFNPEYWENMTV